MNPRALVVFLACLFSSPAWCVNGPWSMAVPTGTTAALNAVATNGAVDVAVGANGVVFSSVDGTHWAKVTTGYEALADNLVSVIWTGGKFYAVGDHGLVLESADGAHWVGQYPLPWELVWQAVLGFSRVVASNNLIIATDFAAFGFVPQPLTTKDGSTWTAAPIGANHFAATKNIAWGPGSFYGISGGTIQSSTDGLTGTPFLSYPGSQACDLVSDGTTLVVQDISGHFYTTTDGVHWSGPGPLTTIGCYISRGLRWTGHDFVWFNSYAPSSYYISADGLNWTAHTTPAGYIFNDMIWDGAKYIAVGTFGTILTSPDGATWTEVSGPGNAAVLNSPALSAAVESIVWDGSQFIAATNSSVIVGSGASWQTVTPPTTLYPLSFVNDKTYGTTGGFPEFESTPDGIHWNPVTGLGGGYDAIGGDGHSQVVALSRMLSAVSNDDGVTWTTKAEGFSAYLVQVIRVPGEYVAISGKSVLTSSDGVNWSENVLVSAIAPGFNLSSIAYGNNTFVITAQDSSIYSSTDAVNWSKHSVVTSGASLNVALSHVAWDGSEFLAIGGTGSGQDPAIYANNVWVSADGATWYPEVLPPGMAVSAIGTGGGQVLIGGRNGDLAAAMPGQRGIPVASDVSITAAPSTLQTLTAPATMGSFNAAEPQGLPLTYMLVGGASAMHAGAFTETIPDQKSGKFVVTTIETNAGPIGVKYVVSNDVVYSASATVNIAAGSPSPTGGSPGPSTGGKSGGGDSGVLELLGLLAATWARRRFERGRVSKP